MKSIGINIILAQIGYFVSAKSLNYQHINHYLPELMVMIIFLEV